MDRRTGRSSCGGAGEISHTLVPFDTRVSVERLGCLLAQGGGDGGERRHVVWLWYKTRDPTSQSKDRR